MNSGTFLSLRAQARATSNSQWAKTSTQEQQRALECTSQPAAVSESQTCPKESGRPLTRKTPDFLEPRRNSNKWQPLLTHLAFLTITAFSQKGYKIISSVQCIEAMDSIRQKCYHL